jgi:hypothetical protein
MSIAMQEAHGETHRARLNNKAAFKSEFLKSGGGGPFPRVPRCPEGPTPPLTLGEPIATSR